MPSATLKLFDALRLTSSDVFFDLGAGIGKVIVFAALATNVGRAVGVELASRRIAKARAVVGRAHLQGLVADGRIELRKEDLLQTDLSQATVLYTCSTAFSRKFMTKLMRKIAGLQRRVTFVSCQGLDDHPAFVEREILRLDMSWRRRSKVYVYDVGSPRPSHARIRSAGKS